MHFELLHPADQLVMIMQRIYRCGMTTTSGGNLSILDDNGDIWITPGGVDKGSLTPQDIICVKADGTIEGSHKPSVELPFHQHVYRICPDIRAVLHAHPPALVAFSIVREIPNTHLIPNVNLVCGEVGMAEYALPGSMDLGEKIAAVFARGNKTVVLENHGIVVGAENLFQAFMSFETLDFCARLEIKARQIGRPIALSQEALELATQKQHGILNEFTPKVVSSQERAARREMCQLIHRAYDQQLFTSTQGTFSQRLSDDSFLITPYMVDRKYIDVHDLVRVDGGCCEKGKTPSRSVMLHKLIYDQHSEINSVIIAHPPNIMTFVVTREAFDSRIIPESYILLQVIPKLPFGTNFLDPQHLVDTISSATPLVMLENDCVLVTGSSLLNAFDRLEVAEYSAKAVIAAHSLGQMVMINDREVTEIKEAFHL